MGARARKGTKSVVSYVQEVSVEQQPPKVDDLTEFEASLRKLASSRGRRTLS